VITLFVMHICAYMYSAISIVRIYYYIFLKNLLHAPLI